MRPNTRLHSLLVILVCLCAFAVPSAAAPAHSPALANPAPNTRAFYQDVETDNPLANALRDVVEPLNDDAEYDTLMNLVGDAHIVMIGEATHGTEEFYRIRADITRQLIEEQGFTAIAVEADWHAAFRVNEYVRGLNTDTTPEESLNAFERFPVWMWRNTVVRDFVAWLNEHNTTLAADETPVGFYGLDLYGMYESADSVVEALTALDPSAGERARERYRCFQDMGATPEEYAYATMLSPESCEEEVLAQLEDVQRLTSLNETTLTSEERLSLEQNALVVVNAEAYYRSMYDPGVSTWNMRDQHMAGSASALIEHLEAQGAEAKIVVWAHNSHIGDAEATDMWARGELNIGHLMRERFGDDAVLIGFSTYTGTVTAAHNWGEDPVVMEVNPGLPESYEGLFHEVGIPNFLLTLRDNQEAIDLLNTPRLQRAIGVMYLPETERFSHYLEANLPEQFDAIIHLDETTALTPIDPIPSWEAALAELTG